MQYFYIGKNIAGILCIIISLVTCGLWQVVTFVQGILMLLMSDEEFNRKFLYTQSKFPLF